MVTGEIFLITTIIFDNLAIKFANRNIKLELPNPKQSEINSYMKASFAERRKLQGNYKFILKDGYYNVSLTPDLFGHIGYELIREETFVNTQRQLFDLLHEIKFEKQIISRIYYGYNNEDKFWI